MTDHYEMPHRRADECPHAGVGKACRPCRDRFERTPITPDERAEWRALADAAFPGPWTVIEDHVRVHGVGTNPGEKEASVFEDRRVGTADARFIAAARTAVPRLLDALDTAEADRDEARAASARVREAAARCVADEAAESELTITRQRDRLRAREEQVRRLRAEVTRLHALVADLRAARPAPVWDEDTVTEAAARWLHTDACSEYDYAWESNADTFRDQARGLLAVVWEHLPVSGESRATVQAEALRAYAADLNLHRAVEDGWEKYGDDLCGDAPDPCLFWDMTHAEQKRINDRADRLEKGADRG